ncbi:MAG: DNA-3-methyladenine glycosylase I [Gammaproteobacteria bacterium]|uniref:DNA-3-methyladenine glycosylase I n=1 Tax=OM182 bacterium MED-G24 TaxID=1986255 RepID=A0A2A5WX55_9GAMM|nr:DNA-3-methyladenine glycosylase I [Gammaproteobacteria bacterium]PDH41150.1 MAG: DNA-3-methyladenine glycosylase I [OM182 bacterium MED-G24]RPG27308.1 MAG: DNA-3-methyladenine glycosylase I [Gammaproteobacteria bacterium TMED50]
MNRCAWCGDDPTYVSYHDNEWGVPCFDERALFESLVLEGAQAGLSWITILRKRPRYREVMDGFDVDAIANYDNDKVANLLADPGIVRNRLKIAASIDNARALITLRQQGISFVNYIWSFVDHRPIVNAIPSEDRIPGSTAISMAMSRSLKRHGFRFVGPTICYAFMQACGLVNDHVIGCDRFVPCQNELR